MTDDLFVNQLITKSLIVSKDSSERFFTGLLTVQMKDKQGEILIVDELMKTLPIWMKRGGFISDTHSNRIIGKGINYAKTTVKDNGQTFQAIEITGVIFKDYKLDDDIWRRMQSGEYRGLSFGGATKSDREPVTYSDGSLAYNLKDLEHYEVAVCRDPAVPLALITGIHTLAKAQAKAPAGVTFETKDLGNGLCKFGCKNAGIYITKPMGEYADFASCVAANHDKGNPDAYCGEIKHRTEDKEKSQGCTICGASEMDHTEHAGHVYKGMVEAGTDGQGKCPYCGYQPELGSVSLQSHLDKEHPDKVNKDAGGSGTRSDMGARGDNDTTGQHGTPATEAGNIDEVKTKGAEDVPPQNEHNMPHPNEPVDPEIDQASHRTKHIHNILDSLEVSILLSKISSKV